MKALSARALIACVLAATAVLPGTASAGEQCRTVSDDVGDHHGVVGVQASVIEPGAGDGVDLTGFAIYLAGWGDLIVQVGVADVDAPMHPAADADRYAVGWDIDGRRFTMEALRTELGWSYASWVRRTGIPPDAEAIEDETYPVTGTVDTETDTFTMVLPALALEGPAGPRTLRDVAVLAEEIRRTGLESIGGDTQRAAAPFGDRAPDTSSGTTAIELDVACGPSSWVGATPMCRLAEDPRDDVAPVAAAVAGDGSSSLDLTGIFVASDGSNLVLELGVAGIDPDDGTSAGYGIDVDIDGRTLNLAATRSAEGWRYEGRFYGDEFGSLPVAGAASADRVRFEIPADLVRAAFTGRPMRAFSGWTATTLADLIGVEADEAGDDDPSVSAYTLGGPCSGL